MKVKNVEIPAKTIRVRMLVMRLASVNRKLVAHCYRAGCDAPVRRRIRDNSPREYETSIGLVHSCREHLIDLPLPKTTRDW